MLQEPSRMGYSSGSRVSLQCVMKAVRRIQRSCCPNARVLLGDARFILGYCFPPEWLHAVYMNFPCPWPKTRHAKRRVTYSGFSDVLAGSLATGGIFELVTDDGIYADDVSRIILVPTLHLYWRKEYLTRKGYKHKVRAQVAGTGQGYPSASFQKKGTLFSPDSLKRRELNCTQS